MRGGDATSGNRRMHGGMHAPVLRTTFAMLGGGWMRRPGAGCRDTDWLQRMIEWVLVNGQSLGRAQRRVASEGAMDCLGVPGGWVRLAPQA